MFMKVVATGSKGNSYIIGNENEVLLLEAGVPFIEVKKALDFKVSNIVGLIVSHGHG